ncbi:MAG: GFA family protein [Novosphingobium sp.]
MAHSRTGGCLCGAVRYEAQWPPAALVVCHCRNCQKQAGSALSVVGVLPREGLTLTGELRVYEDRGTTGQPVFRKFCPTCGSPVVTDTPAAEAQGLIFIKAGTLDETTDLQPTLHYWKQSAQGWFVFPEGVECLETQ